MLALNAPKTPARQAWLLHATVFLLSLMEFLQSGMTSFAAGPLMGEIGMSPEDFSFVAGAYAGVAILAISMQHWCVERFGGRRYVQGAALLSGLGAVLCASSHDGARFLLGRVVMAAGAGAFFTSSRMIIQHQYVGPRRFVGIKALATGLSSGLALAPLLAALAVSWGRAVDLYWGLAVLSLLLGVLAQCALPAEPLKGPGAGAEPIVWEQGLLLASSLALLYALQRFYYDYYGNVAGVMLALCLALAGMAVYLHRQHRRDDPLLSVRGLLGTRYLSGLMLFFVVYVLLGANNYVVPQMLQRALSLGWDTVGHVQAAALAVAVFTWGVMAWVLPRYPAPRKFLVVGFASLAACGAWLARMDTEAALWSDVLPPLALNSVFLLTVMPTAAMQTFRGLEHDDRVFANAQQLKNMMSQAGIALGITLATLGQQWRTAEHYNVLSAGVASGSPAFVALSQQLQQAFAQATGPAQAAQLAMAQIAQMLMQQASMLAGIDHFAMVAVLGALGVVVMLVQRVFR